MVVEYLAVIAAISGGISGALFAYLLNQYNSQIDEKKQIKSVRKLVNLEIDLNLEKLRKVWDWINEIDIEKDMIITEDENKNYNKINMAYKFSELKLSHFTKEYWNSQLHIVPIAFNMAEIGDIHKFYHNLFYIHEIHKTFQEDIESKDLGDIPDNWDQFEAIFYKLTEEKPVIKV